MSSFRPSAMKTRYFKPALFQQWTMVSVCWYSTVDCTSLSPLKKSQPERALLWAYHMYGNCKAVMRVCCLLNCGELFSDFWCPQWFVDMKSSNYAVDDKLGHDSQKLRSDQPIAESDEWKVSYPQRCYIEEINKWTSLTPNRKYSELCCVCNAISISQFPVWHWTSEWILVPCPTAPHQHL